MSLLRFMLICALLNLMPYAARAQGNVENIPTLHRGLNLSSWLANAPRQPLYARDFAQIRQAGFDHLRLPFNPEYVGYKLSPEANPTQIDFTALDRAVALGEQYGLPVILDLHPSSEFIETLERHSWAEFQFIELWKVIAQRYQSHSSAALIFELLNEPQYYKSEELWTKLSASTIAAIRMISSDRLIIVGAPHGSDIEGLSYLQPTNDPRLIYAFHFYEPYIITHQGIHMGFEKKAIRYFRGVPYPSTLATESASHYAPDAPDLPLAGRELSEYRSAPWNPAHIKSRIDVARDWAAQHRVKILCGEWGVLRNHIDTGSRYRWITDTHAALESDGIGWELWDYADLFGITSPVGPTTTDSVDGSVRLIDPEKGSRSFEPDALAALGLRTGTK